ncbi:hypothetical protein FZEAL_3330 [Fusarium zealandicum]|uniref:Protein kinase domain-containing protein n=1 Tax=Fusarium zealandicum TaxID=1053134 RepID=A0A8H4XN18_9HYPO|nr:hypothetical protein FZEAL_3330 [Fusarium zealandicum]
MSDELEKLRKQIEELQLEKAAAQDQISAAQARAAEAEQERDEAEKERDEAEKERDEARKRTQPLKLKPYLGEFHAIDSRVPYIHERTLTTQGITSDPTGRIYPERIIPWKTFPEEQGKIWATLMSSPSFSDKAMFPSLTELGYVKARLDQVSSEMSLRISQRKVVEDAITELISKAHDDVTTRNALGLQGNVVFQDHTNLGSLESVDSAVDHLPLDPNRTPPPPQHRKAQGKGARADQWCIYRTADGGNVPTVAIEYKAPHKLTRREIDRGLNTGLHPDIRPDRDVIGKDAKDGDEFDFAAKRLATAVVTQLFSYMVGKGVQYGYICTGEVFVFLHIPDHDPTQVRYFTSVPILDAADTRFDSEAGTETGIYRTAVAHVFAFILQATQASPPSQSWFTKANNLPEWKIEYEDVLRDIPSTQRKSPDFDPYCPSPWTGFGVLRRTPDKVDSSSSEDVSASNDDHDDDDSDDDSDDDNDASPSQDRARRRNPHRRLAAQFGSKETSGTQRHGGKGTTSQGNRKRRQRVQDRPYCTQECLHGLAFAGPIDSNCPNRLDHGDTHIGRKEFLRLTREQLAVDRDKDADCTPLYLSGSRGSLFKLRLSSHGYTLVAKGVEAMDTKQLRYENSIYGRIRDLQGQAVPVCLGTIHLVAPYYFDSGVYVHFMLLSYGGRSIFREVKTVDAALADKVITVLNRLHQHGILHRDAEPRNVLYDKGSGKCMMVDLMLAEVLDRQQPRTPLGPASLNIRERDRGFNKGGMNGFVAEREKLQRLLL